MEDKGVIEGNRGIGEREWEIQNEDQQWEIGDHIRIDEGDQIVVDGEPPAENGGRMGWIDGGEGEIVEDSV